jgi:hypothetical protein
MKEFEEDNLENFFRNRAEGDQYEFQKEDWDKMATKLDADDLAAGFGLGKYFWMAIGAAITSIIFLGYIQFTKSADPVIVTPISQVVETTTPVPQESQEALAIDNSEDAEQVNSVNKIAQQVQESAQKSINSTQIVIDKPRTHDSSSAIYIASDEQQKNVHNGVLTTNKTIEESKLVDRENKKTGIISQVPSKTANRNTATTPDSDILMAEAIRAPYLFYDIPIANPNLQKQPITDEGKLKRFYTLGLTAAIDFSSTSESQWGSPVLRLGLSAEYFITNRLSLGLGINISEKKYSAKGREYAPPKGFWTNGVVPDSTNASCQVLDIPLTLSYFQPVGHQGSIVFHAGLSSWFMLKEKYYYKYISNDPDLVKSWHGENENRYWFGIVNMAVSYEHVIHNRWSIMAGPYLNLPLVGVGHGNVELRSFGMRASLRLNKYKLPEIY